MQSSPTILFAVICGFFAIIIMMVALVVFVSRKEKAKNDKTARALGMTPVADSDYLLEQVAYVNGINRKELYRVEGVYQRRTGGGDVFMFNFHRRDIKRQTAGSRSSKIHYHPLETNVLAFVSPTWHFPRFTVIPRLGGEGKLAVIANSIAESIAEIKMDVVNFPHIPGLDERYLIATSDPSTAQDYLSDAFLRTIASTPKLILHTGGNTLTLSYSNSTTQPPDEEGMKQLYKIGVQLAKDVSEKR